MRWLFILTIFLGSFLLFLIQPMIAKMVLPYFGGTPGVWNTSMVFFQAVLLVGYAYAHIGPRKLGLKPHAGLHAVLFGVSLLLLPFSIASSFNPAKSSLPEALTLLSFLTVTVGLPYFVVSAGAPLIQKWFSHTSDPKAHDPYFLYAASNIGSLLALLSYPFVIEMSFSLVDQSRLWMGGFIALALLVMACAISSLRNPAHETALPATPAPARSVKLRWLLLSAVPSSLLLGVTTYLTTNVAAFPLLWIIPLSLYLVTFIWAFANRFRIKSIWSGRIVALLMAPMTLILVLEASKPFIPMAAFHLAVFFVGALMCHSELAESRPAADHLTEFYLILSLGGVLGGAFTAILAPGLFDTIAEYPIALVGLLLLRPWDKEKPFGKVDVLYPAAVMAITFAIWLGVKNAGMPPSGTRTALTMGIPAVLAFFAIDRPIRYGLAIGAFLMAAHFINFGETGKLLVTKRSFFGVHRVAQYDSFQMRQLTHGNTIHGRQSLNPEWSRLPLTYYYPTGPIGQIMETYLPLLKSPEVALIGLGVGSLSAYAREGDRFTFFEIDPTVVEVAKDPKYFTYLSNAKAPIDIVMGDARISMQSEPDGKYDIVAVDAFSSDSIPVHLITNEAIQLFLKKCKPDGIVVFHVSNRYLVLDKVLAGAVQELGLIGRFCDDPFVSPEEELQGKTSSKWFAVSRTEKAFDPLKKNAMWEDAKLLDKLRPWTDDRSNILEAWDTEN